MKRSLALLLLAAGACVRGPGPPSRDAVQEAFAHDALRAAEARGHRVFERRCAPCHGLEGRGDGPNAYNLSPAPPDFRESLANVPVALRRRIIEGGTAAVGRSPLCPPRGRSLSADERVALLAWLETAARGARPAPEASR